MPIIWNWKISTNMQTQTNYYYIGSWENVETMKSNSVQFTESIWGMFGMGVAFEFLLNFEFYECVKICYAANEYLNTDWLKKAVFFRTFLTWGEYFLAQSAKNKRFFRHRKICVVNSEEPENNLIFVMCLVPHKLDVTISPATESIHNTPTVSIWAMLLSMFANCERGIICELL